MNVKSLVFVLTLFLSFGMALLVVNADTEVNADIEVNADTKTTPEKKETKSYEDLTDEEKKEVDKNVQKVLDKLTESMEGLKELSEDEIRDEEKLNEKLSKILKNLANIEDVKVEVKTSSDESDTLINHDELKEFSEKIIELAKDESLDDEALEKKIKKLVKNLDVRSIFDIDNDNVKVITSEPLVITKVYNNEDNLTGLMKKITELTKDENLNEDQLDEKLKKLLKDSKLENVIVSDDDNVTVIVASDVKKTKGLTEIAKDIAELAKDEELDVDQLAEKIKEIVKENPSALIHRIDLGDKADIKVLKTGSIVSSNKSNASDAIDKLTKRVEKLEKKIDALIEMLSK